MPDSLSQLIPDIQAAIGPVILISGVGLLLLTMTNRYGRIIDRCRHLAAEAPAAHGADRAKKLTQLTILSRRLRIMRSSIFLATLCVLFVSLLIIVLFLASMLRTQATWLVVSFFVAALICLILSLIAFMRDIHISLVAVELELRQEDAGSE
jgi:hypothetical protein